jgi:hypothetical protein
MGVHLVSLVICGGESERQQVVGVGDDRLLLGEETFGMDQFVLAPWALAAATQLSTNSGLPATKMVCFDSP